MKVKSGRKKVVLLWGAGEQDHAEGFYRRIVDQYDSPDAPSVVKIVVRGSQCRLAGQYLPAGKSDHIETPRKHKQEGYRGLSVDFLWYSSRQDNTISRMWQVYVSPVMTRWTRLFGWTSSSLPTL